MTADMKNIIITGANSGIGLVAAKKLCGAGHHVIMACRSKERAEEAIADIKKTQKNAQVTFMQLNLASLSSVRQFAEDFKQKSIPLHVLVNNAGVFFSMNDKERQTTEDGFEMTIGTNHLGPFLLTQLLLDNLKETASSEGEARIVNVTSTLHDHESDMGKRSGGKPIDFEDLMLEKEGAYTAFQGYKNSKAGNVLFTKSLAKQLEGTGVTVNCMCPGFIPRTGLSRHATSFQRFMLINVLDGFMKLFKKITRSPDEGGQSIVTLATSDELKGKSGGYYSSDKLMDSSAETCDEEVQKKMWDISTKLVKL